MDSDEIAAPPIKGIAADDCVLLLWATAPMLRQAIQVMEEWGFEYRSHACWVKDRMGTGSTPLRSKTTDRRRDPKPTHSRQMWP